MAAQSWEWPDPAAYGDVWAHDYDQLTGASPELTSATIDGLARLAAGRPVLEVAAGTGRVAIPLAEAGGDVSATDASPKMLARLREKDQAGLVRTWVEALPAVGGDAYAVIAILQNSIWALRSAQEQQEFFHNAAAHLTPDGLVVVEATIVDTGQWARSKEVRLGSVMAHWTTRWDPATQQACHTFHLPEPIVPSQRQVYVRYLGRDELLSMAAAAGLAPRHLWSAWDGTPHGPDSSKLIAVLQHAHTG